MKSNKRLEQEIKSVADIWDSFPERDMDLPKHRIASAIYHALRWARGYHEGDPTAILHAYLEKVERQQARERDAATALR